MTWDVVDVDTQTALAGCAEGTFETIDWAKLGLDRSKFIGGDVTGLRRAEHPLLHGRRLRHDQDRSPGRACSRRSSTPTKYPGKRALQKSPFVNLEWALMADGVAAGRCLQGAGHG